MLWTYFQTLFLRHGKRQVIFNYLWHPKWVWICEILSEKKKEVEAAGVSETNQWQHRKEMQNWEWSAWGCCGHTCKRQVVCPLLSEELSVSVSSAFCFCLNVLVLPTCAEFVVLVNCHVLFKLVESRLWEWGSPSLSQTTLFMSSILETPLACVRLDP